MDEPDRTQPTHEIATAPTRAQRPGKLVVRVVAGPKSGEEYPLTGTSIRVGRSRVADLRFDDRSLSSRHFELRPTAKGAWLRDLGSTNGTFFAGRRVEAVELHVGDEFRAGGFRFALTEVSEVEVDTLEREHFGQLRGASLAMRELFAQLSALGPTSLDVLITGETGTGKELTARTLHRLSGRKGPFKVLDCGALSPSLAEGTLFGFVKGTFTGADRDRPGLFEAGEGGTIFIDEIGELRPDLQVKLLRFLAEREVTRLGESHARKIDVRVVAATHRDLREAIDQGIFRQDLYYRLARSLVRTPPLREREGDVVLLAEAFLRDLRARHTDIDVTLGEAAKHALQAHRWPGNVRELRNVIEQAAHLERSGELDASDLRLDSARASAPVASLAKTAVRDKTYREYHLDLDRVILPRLLDEFDHNRSRIAAHLAISRDKLRTLLKELGLYSRRR